MHPLDFYAGALIVFTRYSVQAHPCGFTSHSADPCR